MEVCFVGDRMVVSQAETWGSGAYVGKWQKVTKRLPLGWHRLLAWLGSVLEGEFTYATTTTRRPTGKDIDRNLMSNKRICVQTAR